MINQKMGKYTESSTGECLYYLLGDMDKIVVEISFAQKFDDGSERITNMKCKISGHHTISALMVCAKKIFRCSQDYFDVLSLCYDDNIEFNHVHDSKYLICVCDCQCYFFIMADNIKNMLDQRFLLVFSPNSDKYLLETDNLSDLDKYCPFYKRKILAQESGLNIIIVDYIINEYISKPPKTNDTILPAIIASLNDTSV